MSCKRPLDDNFDDNSNEEVNFDKKDQNDLMNLDKNENVNFENTNDLNSESTNQLLSNNKLSYQLKNKSTSLKNLVLDLKWSVRNRVINNLYNLSALLYASKISNKTINKSIDENHKLIAILIGLPGEDYISLLNPNKRIKESSEDQLILKLNWNLRCQIIESLMNNHHCILYHQVVDKSNKLNLINENNLLITTLTNLPIKNDDDVIFDDDLDDESVDDQKLNYGLKEDLYHKSTDSTRSLQSLNGTTIDHDLIKKELVDFKEEIKEIMNVKNSENTIKTKFNIDALLNNRKTQIFTESIKCSDFQFLIRPGIRVKDNVEYLSLHLQTSQLENPIDTIFRIRILNQLTNDRHQEKLLNCKLNNKVNITGFNYFMQLDKLLNESNNYLDKERNFHLEVYLKIVDVIKTNDTQF